jgi:hypothetical protein
MPISVADAVEDHEFDSLEKIVKFVDRLAMRSLDALFAAPRKEKCEARGTSPAPGLALLAVPTRSGPYSGEGSLRQSNIGMARRAHIGERACTGKPGMTP